MGRPKPWLPFGAETLLARVVRRLGEVVQPVAVVGAADQKLPEPPAEVRLAHDLAPGCGPLEGLRAGLIALSDAADAAYVTGCDAALVQPEFVVRMCDLLGDYDAAVPVIDGVRQTLASVCHVSVLRAVEEMLAAKNFRTHELFDRLTTRWVAADEFADVDPGLLSLRNLNTPEEYRAALHDAGLAE